MRRGGSPLSYPDFSDATASLKDVIIRMSFRRRWTIVVVAASLFVFLLIYILYPSRSVDCVCPKCPNVQQLCNCKVDLERIGLGKNRPVHVSKNKFPRKKPSSLYRPEIRKEGWIVDCITFDDKWESNEMEADPHEFNFDEVFTEETKNERQERFVEIFRKRIWPGSNSARHVGIQSSGRGALLQNAQSVMASLHVIVMKLKSHLGKSVISVLDIGCGDLQWMNLFLLSRADVEYTCIEIVPDLVQHHKREINAGLPRRAKFLQGDIVHEAINSSYDLILCRDTFQYLHQMDAMRAIHQISRSGSKYLLATTFPDTTQNGEIENKTLSVFNYPYNLELPPFVFEPPICSTYDWSVEHLALWSLPVRQKYDY